ncbi:hypothetical protein ACQP1K_13430 [Sphaerimonospora sp. CA-214678]
MVALLYTLSSLGTGPREALHDGKTIALTVAVRAGTVLPPGGKTT